MQKKNKSKLIKGLSLGLFVFFVFYFALPEFSSVDFSWGNEGMKIEEGIVEKKITHLPTPEPLKAIYMSACVVGTPSIRDGLIKLIEDTELNAVVIDVKDFSGTLSYPPINNELKHAWDASKCGAPDMKDFLELMKQKNIYTIARVTVFQDPHFSKLHPELSVQSKSKNKPWADRKGLNFLDVGGRETWKYTVSIAKDAHDIGFDEINFDYIRYPSDGNMADASYTLSTKSKQEELEDFFEYLNSEMKKIGVVTSADLFGMTTTSNFDLNIGQVLERALPYFDYVAPMVYPSHYPPNFNGWKDPNKVPYELIKYVMSEGLNRVVSTSTSINIKGSEMIASSSPALFTKESYSPLKLRTWIQDFDYGGNYDVAEVKAQIKGVYDSGLTSWMIWSPSNKYTKGALEISSKQMSSN